LILLDEPKLKVTQAGDVYEEKKWNGLFYNGQSLLKQNVMKPSFTASKGVLLEVGVEEVVVAKFI
jgi:hypothetical protein